MARDSCEGEVTESELVSCIMVTGHQDRGAFPRQALRSFLEQTYARRELIIINQNPDRPLLPHVEQEPSGMTLVDQPGVSVCEHMVDGKRLTLGDLRNEGLFHALGSWFISWDDDDWQHPERLATMMARKEPGKALVPTYHVRYSFPAFAAWQSHNPEDGAGGIALYPMTDAKYPSLETKEDSTFYITNFKHSRVLWDNADTAHYYLRFWHGINTGSNKHVMRGYADAHHRWQQKHPHAISVEGALYLREILRDRYDVEFPENMHWHKELNPA